MADICRRAAGACFGSRLKSNQTRARGVKAARHGPFMGREEAKSGAGQGERRTVYYTGHVQGVGFRYTARAAAQSCDVVGFVRNLDDGRVQIVAEGGGQQ